MEEFIIITNLRTVIDCTHAQRVTDVLTHEVINTWKPDEAVLIHGGMGIGKTYWVLHMVCSYYAQRNQKVLMVFPRIPIRQETIHERWKYDVGNLDTTSYQHIENEFEESRSHNTMIAQLKQYACIVCDEYHYWIQDSIFNKKTEYSYNAIMHETAGVQKVLLSATPHNVVSYLNHDSINCKEYLFDTTYRTANQIAFFNEDETIDKLLQDSVENHIKTIVFIQKATEAFELYKKYQECAQFVTSATEFNKYRNLNAELKTQRTKRFDSLILITTTKMEVGVTLRDVQLKRIIIKVFDPISVTQCAGRKRMNDANDKAELFIYSYSGSTLNGKKRALTRNVEEVREYQQDRYGFIASHGRAEYTAGGILVPTAHTNQFDWIMNKHRHHYATSLINRIKYMQDRSYADGVLYCLRPAVSADIILNFEEFFLVEKLKSRLNSDGFDLIPDKTDRKSLIELVNVRRNGKPKKSRKAINQYLQQLPTPFVIDVVDYYDNLGVRHQQAWKLRKLG